MKTVKTARGRTIDMSAIRAKHEDTRAISNMPINAKGDIIDNRGKVVVPREEISKEYYKQNLPGIEQRVSIKEEEGEPEVVAQPAEKVQEEPKKPAPKPKATPQPVSVETEEVTEINRRQRSREDGTSYWEIEFSDGSMEIEEA